MIDLQTLKLHVSVERLQRLLEHPRFAIVGKFIDGLKAAWLRGDAYLSAKEDDKSPPFALLRYFSIVSGIVILTLIVVAVAAYRQVRHDSFKSQMQRQNEVHARSMANSIWLRYGKYLLDAGQLDTAALLERPETQDLNTELRQTTKDTGILKLKIYAPTGLTIFSTEFGQIGDRSGEDPVFRAMIEKKSTRSTISTRSHFMAQSGLVKDVTMLETFVPIIGIDDQIKTVVELYVDITPNLREIQSETFKIACGIIGGLGVLYFLLYLVIIRADRILSAQRGELAAFSADLEARVERRTRDLKRAHDQIETLNADLESRVAARTEELHTAHESVHQLNVELANSIIELKDAQDTIIKKGKLAQLGQLTATVAHEIRNPLGAIKTSAQLVERKVKNQNLGLEKPLERINSGIRRCDYIITELLDFARSNDLVTKKTALDTWVRSIVEEERRNIPDAVAIECDLQLGDQDIDFDSERMRRVLVNLLSNASEAMVGKGAVQAPTIRQNPRIDVSTRLVDGNVEIIVKDNGPGISEEHIKKIMEPLFTTKTFGVGLGLPAVEKILEQHGGGLRIASQPGEGATFTAWFPLDRSLRQAA